jgi:hypothetical protein
MPPATPAIAHAFFVPENRGDPLGAFPSLRCEGRPYNLWLTEALLERLLPRWVARQEDRDDLGRSVAEDVDAIGRRCRDRFHDLLPAAISAGDPALLAALGVTANLLRTAALLGEFLVGGGRLVTGEPAGPAATFKLSRYWCGLIEYGAASPYFPARVHPPVHAGRLNCRRRDSRHLSNTLWCSASAITHRCEEATVRLRDAIRRSGIFEPGDLEHLRGPSVSLRMRERK